MRKMSFVLLLAFSLTLFSGCISSQMLDEYYASGYDDGYDDGYFDGEYYTYDEAYDDGFDAGYECAVGEITEDAVDSIFYAIMDCESTAGEEGMHPEEAIATLDEYLNGKNHSKSDLRMAVNSLWVYYYETLSIDDYVEYNLDNYSR